MRPDAGPAPEAVDPLVGQTLGGTYRVETVIGRGAMGVVYRARHALLDQDYAVKVLHPELTEDEEVRRRFLLEARSLTAFTHKHAVQVRHCAEDHGQLFLVMDLVAGESLAARLARDGKLAPAVAANVIVQVLEALEEAHAAGIVHRDVKPANILVEAVVRADGRAEERARVVDFGLARWVGPHAQAHGSALASQGGRVVGTVAYMAPEQLRCEEVDARADLFGVGAVLYEALTGERPFPGESLLSAAARVMADPPRAWSPADVSAVPEALRGVVERALEKDPDQRWQSAGQMAEALREALGTGRAVRTTVTPRPPPPAATSSTRTPVALESLAFTPPRRGRVVVGIVIALLALGAAAWWGLRGDEAPALETLLESGWEHYASGRDDEARAAFSRAVDVAPGDGRGWLGRAQARIGLGDRSGAASDLEEARRLLPDDVPVHLARAELLEHVERDAPRAGEELKAALWIDQTRADTRAARAAWALRRGDFELAEKDISALEANAPNDPRGPALRVRLRIDASRTLPAEGQAVIARETLAIAEHASALDVRWAGGAQALGLTHSSITMHERGQARDAEANAHAQKALAATAEAVRRARADPVHRLQGRELPIYYIEKAGAAFLSHQPEEALVDLDQAVALRPHDELPLSQRAYALQQAGHHERARADYEKLYDITQRSDPWFRLGFGVQVLGLSAFDAGDLAAARAHYERAEQTYTRGIARFDDNVDLRRYRGEVRVQLGRLGPAGAERDARFAAAEVDFADALRLDPPQADPGETELRRAELRLAQGRSAEALDDLRKAVARRNDRTPRYHFRLAQAALAEARRPGIAQDVRAALLEEAVRGCDRAVSLHSGRHLVATLLMGEVRIEQATGVDAEARERALDLAREARAQLESWGRPEGDPGGTEAAARARLLAVFLGAELDIARGNEGSARRALDEALAGREAERAAGRWSLDPRWYDLKATLAERAGDAASAAAARERAASLPR
jgi:serine/threonine protein kinase/Flp pilus assembly protein TadD